MNTKAVNPPIHRTAHPIVRKHTWTIRGWIAWQLLKRGIIVYLWPSKRRFIKRCARSMRQRRLKND